MGEIGTVYSLNYEPEIEEGFVSKVVVRLLECRDDYMKSVEIATADEFYRNSLCQEYELNGRHRFSGDYIQAIDDVFFYINDSHPDLETTHSRFGKIRFRDCYFGIDVLDPPATPISLYSGDSVGAAIFLCLVSAFFEFKIESSAAVTGSLRSRYSKEVGMVGNIPGKVRGFIDIALDTKHSRIRHFSIPDVEYLLEEELINRDDLKEIIEELEAFKSKTPDKQQIADWLFFPKFHKCRSLDDFFLEVYDLYTKKNIDSVLKSLGWDERIGERKKEYFKKSSQDNKPKSTGLLANFPSLDWDEFNKNI